MSADLSFDKVMVFPQGIFSTASMAVLKANNYLASVNFEMIPVDLHANCLTLRDLLLPSVMKFYGFPLFLRRHPWEFEELALDLFLGRPALIMTHHDSFGDGQAELMRSIDRVNNISNRLKWSRLAEIIKTTYLWKYETDRSLYVKLFSPETIIHNETASTNRYMVTKQEPDSGDIEGVFLNGQKTNFDSFDGLASLCFQVEPACAASIRFLYRSPYPISSTSNSILRQLNIAGRRWLSEVRDNHIMTNRRLYSALNKFKKK